MSNPSIAMACFAFMALGAAVVVMGGRRRRFERRQIYDGERPSQWGGRVMLAGAALYLVAFAVTVWFLFIVKIFK